MTSGLGTVNSDGHNVDSKGNPQVDFVWGNFPLAGNDQRSTVLDFTKANHVIVEEGWNGYPLYAPNTTGVEVPPTLYVIVPNVLGETVAVATKALTDAGFTTVTVAASTTSGTYTSGQVNAQSVAAGAANVAPGGTITITPTT